MRKRIREPFLAYVLKSHVVSWRLAFAGKHQIQDSLNDTWWPRDKLQSAESCKSTDSQTSLFARCSRRLISVTDCLLVQQALAMSVQVMISSFCIQSARMNFAVSWLASSAQIEILEWLTTRPQLIVHVKVHKILLLKEGTEVDVLWWSANSVSDDCLSHLKICAIHETNLQSFKFACWLGFLGNTWQYRCSSWCEGLNFALKVLRYD